MSDGTIERGHFKNNKLEGQGTRIWLDGRMDKGMFKEGRLNGQGTIYFANDEIHKGDFIDDILDGEGSKNIFQMEKSILGHLLMECCMGMG